MGEGIRKLYSAEDEIFKLASFYKRIQGRKISTETARAEFKEAMADYVDYSTPLPDFVRAIDRNGLFPFVHYVYKSTPRVAKIIVKNPIKYTMLQVALYQMGASLFNEDDNAQKPEWAEDKGFAGQSYLKYVPSNLFAAKQYVQMEDSDSFLNLGRGLPGMRLGGLRFDGGFIGSIINIVSGKDPRGREYIDKEDSTATALAKGLMKTTESFAPPMTIGRYAQRATKKALDIDPARNDYGIEQGWEEMALRIFGVWKFDREKHVEKKLMEVIKNGADDGKSKEEIKKELDKTIEFAKNNKIRYAKKKVAKKIPSDIRVRSEQGELYKKLKKLVHSKRGSSRDEILKFIRPILAKAKSDGIVLDSKNKGLLGKHIDRKIRYYD